MKQNRVIVLLLMLTVVCAHAQSTRVAGGASAISHSGQFVIYSAAPGAFATATPEFATNSPVVHLEATLLAVSCERIKQALLNTLNVPDQWRGKISISLQPFHSADEDIVVTSQQFTDGWNYRVDLPDVIEPTRLVRALTQVLLLEIANRNARDQSATLPLWLAEGMPPLLMAASDTDLVIRSVTSAPGNQMSSRSITRDSRPVSPLKQAREQLGRRAPLTLEELDRPPADGEAAGIYQSSATVFIHELLQLKNGGPCLASMLPELPWDPDWRVGFLKAFRAHFKREVDLAKWWSLQSAFIAGRTPAKTWSRAESLAKLEEILRCPLQVQTSTNDEPFQTDVPLQSIIRRWEPPQQSRMLREKINLLEALRLRTATDLAGLIEQYRRVLEAHLRTMGGEDSEQPAARRDTAGHRAPSLQPQSARNVITKETLLQLDVLDERREAWEALPEKTPAAAP